MPKVDIDTISKIMEPRKKKNWNSRIANMLNEKFGIRSILYIKFFAELSGSINAAILLSQLLYWWGKGSKKGWVFKTANEMREETGLTKDQQASAIKIWEDSEVLEVERFGSPPKRHFKIDIEKLLDLLEISDMDNN